MANPDWSYVLDQAIWAFPAARPRSDRKAAFLVDAVHAVGSAMFGPEWTRLEAHCFANFPESSPIVQMMPARPVPTPPRSIASVPPSLAHGAGSGKSAIDWSKFERPSPASPAAALVNALLESQPQPPQPDAHVTAYRVEESRKDWEASRTLNAAAKARLLAVIDWIGARAQDGALDTLLRYVDASKGLGGYFPARDGVWNVEPLIAHRFRRCQFDYYAPVPPVGPWPVYLFFTQDSLARCVAELPHAPIPRVMKPASAVGAWMSPFMDVMIEAARQSNLGGTPETTPDAEWLKEEILRIASERGVADFTPALAKAAATLLRHPKAKLGLQVWRASEREGSDPKK